MKKLFENDTDLKANEEKYKSIMKKNRELRIEIKSILCENTDENIKKIDELKKNVGFSSKSENFDLNTTFSSNKKSNPTKRELIKFRDYLLEENQKLLYTMTRKLL